MLFWLPLSASERGLGGEVAPATMEGMAILLLLMLAAPDRAPEAAFSVDDLGFLNVKLTRGGAGVEGKIRAYEGQNVVGESETGADGSGTVLPLKPGQSCLLGITLAGKECDLIFLERHGKEARPARVSLTFGTRPCCVNVPRQREVSDPEAMPFDGGMVLLAAAGGMCVLAGLALAIIRGKA